MSVQEILSQKALIQDAMRAAMQDGQHYGKIPGCGDKPTLFQPGAQTILLLFRMNPDYAVETIDLDRGHRDYRVQCRLTNSSGEFIGAGVGSCSTMEGKYRFRVAPKKLTDRPVPADYWNLRKSDPKKAQEILGGPGFSTKKNDDGMWVIAEGSNEKVEHDNPADYYNTCLKMAKKRALVDATLTRTAASDIFTQDIEDLRDNLDAASPTAEVPTPSPSAPNPAADGAQKGEARLVEVEQFSGTNSKTGKPWKRWGLTLEDASGQQLKLGTFDTKLGELAVVLKGMPVLVSFKPGKKEGTFDLTSIAEASDDLPM